MVQLPSVTFHAPSTDRVSARMSRRISLIDRLPDEEFLLEVRAYLCDALPVDLLYRAAATLGTERDRDTARLRRLLERVLKDLRAAKALLASRLTKAALEDRFLGDRLDEFDQVSKGRVALPQEAVAALHGLLFRFCDRAWREHRSVFETALSKYLLRDYRGAITGWRFSEDYDETIAEADRADRLRRVQPWGALQRLIAALRIADPEIDRAVPPGAPLAERRLRSFVKLFADPRDAGKIDPSADALKPIASTRDEATRDLLRVHNYLLDQLERSAAADEALAAYRRRLRLAGAGASLHASIVSGNGVRADEAARDAADPAKAISQDLLRFLFDAGFVPVMATTLTTLNDAEPLAGSADVLPLAIVTAPRTDSTAEHPILVAARNDVSSVMRRTGSVSGYVVALNAHGELPAILEAAEGPIKVFRL